MPGGLTNLFAHFQVVLKDIFLEGPDARVETGEEAAGQSGEHLLLQPYTFCHHLSGFGRDQLHLAIQLLPALHQLRVVCLDSLVVQLQVLSQLVTSTTTLL